MHHDVERIEAGRATLVKIPQLHPPADLSPGATQCGERESETAREDEYAGSGVPEPAEKANRGDRRVGACRYEGV